MADRGTYEWGGDVFRITKEGRDSFLVRIEGGRELGVKIGIRTGKYPIYFRAGSEEHGDLTSLKYAVQNAFTFLKEERDKQVQAQKEEQQRKDEENAARQKAQEEFAAFLESVSQGEPWPGLDD